MSASTATGGEQRTSPWPPLIALAFSALIALLFALPVASKQPAPAMLSRDIRFLAGADGAILVQDARGGTPIARIAPEDQGFTRGFVHALDFIRERHGVAADRPFRLERLRDGRLVLVDPSIAGTAIDVESFGPTNERAVARFLGSAPDSAR